MKYACELIVHMELEARSEDAALAQAIKLLETDGREVFPVSALAQEDRPPAPPLQWGGYKPMERSAGP